MMSCHRYRFFSLSLLLLSDDIEREKESERAFVCRHFDDMQSKEELY